MVDTTAFDFENHAFTVPKKNLVTIPHVAMFKESEGAKDLLGFINALGDSVKQSRMTETKLTEVIPQPSYALATYAYLRLPDCLN